MWLLFVYRYILPHIRHISIHTAYKRGCFEPLAPLESPLEPDSPSGRLRGLPTLFFGAGVGGSPVSAVAAGGSTGSAAPATKGCSPKATNVTNA